MSERQFEVFVGSASLPREDWARIYRYLVKQGVTIVPIDARQDGVSDPAAALEGLKDKNERKAAEPVWVNKDSYRWTAQRLGIINRVIGESWHALEKLETKIDNPEAVEDMWWNTPASSNLPVKFERQMADEELVGIEVEVHSLKKLAEDAKVNLSMKGKSALWQYLGITQIGPGLVDCWYKVSKAILSDLTQGT